MNLSRHRPKLAALVIAAATICLVVALVRHKCRYDPKIPYLYNFDNISWIIFPKPIDPAPHAAVAFDATFKHELHVTTERGETPLRIRMFRTGVVMVNGRTILTNADPAAWKRELRIDIAPHLQRGTNELSIVVTNAFGPPALWVRGESQAKSISTLPGPQWVVSYAGSAWAAAVSASTPPLIRPGHPLFGRETMTGSLHRVWPMAISLLLAAFGLVMGFPMLREKARFLARWDTAQLVFLGVVLGWVVLFVNNLPQLAHLTGFDRDGHLQYIDYIMQKGTLPLADEGWQMYQPPLYYVICALTLGAFGWTTSAPEGLLLLRGLSVVIGLGQVWLVFLSLRLLFPKKPEAQIVGTLLAGILPAQLCLSHHITNETLSALFVTASLWAILRGATAPGLRGCMPWLAGAFLGLAMLTKFSALIVIPFVLIAVFQIELNRDEGRPLRNWKPALQCACACLLAMLVVCGWHYAKVWRYFGAPIVGNWDSGATFAWWQDPGYRTTAWYASFGEAFRVPLFSGIFGFLDGCWSTLWHDGFASGSARMDYRPQWNYDLLNLGSLLDLAWIALLLPGAIFFAKVRCLAHRAAPVLFLGLLASFAAAVCYMTLKVPSYAQAKSFYGLPALLPLCALAAGGYSWLTQMNKPAARCIFAVALGGALIGFSGFWIRSWNPATHLVAAIGYADDNQPERAINCYHQALKLRPGDPVAMLGIAQCLYQSGNKAEALAQVSQAMPTKQSDPETMIQAGTLLALAGRNEEGSEYLKAALSEWPDHPTARQRLAICLMRMDNEQGALREFREGLRVNPFSYDCHYWLAKTAARLNELDTAKTHLHYATQLRPSDIPVWLEYVVVLQATADYKTAIQALHHLLALQPEAPDLLNNLAWILATGPIGVREGAEAVRLARKATELTGNAEPLLLGTLAAALAEAGDYDQAIQTAETARALAQKSGLVEVAKRNEELLQLYRQRKKVPPADQ